MISDEVLQEGPIEVVVALVCFLIKRDNSLLRVPISLSMTASLYLVCSPRFTRTIVVNNLAQVHT